MSDSVAMKVQTEQAAALNIFVGDDLWGYAIQVNGKWWQLFERDEETGDLEHIGVANNEFEIRQKVKERAAE